MNQPHSSEFGVRVIADESRCKVVLVSHRVSKKIKNKMNIPKQGILDMFKQDENPLCIGYSTQKSDIDTVVELGNIF